MKIVLAPDSFKGSLSATEVAKAMANGIQEFDPNISCIMAPIADGGEGSLEAMKMATPLKIVSCRSQDPLGRKIESQYGIIDRNQTAFIEMAATSGLLLLNPAEYNPLATTTYGTGELIKDALDQGIRRFIIAIGGSATNDGGAGMAQAMGVQLLDQQGHEIQAGGEQLQYLDHINLDKLDPRILESQFHVACDVTNPLCGPNGASHVYGPQKGASPIQVEILDKNLSHFAYLIERDVGMDIKDLPGAGAAGGLGAGLMAFCHAQLESGFELIAKACRLEEKVMESDLILTGEGSLDKQTRSGKAPFGVAQLGKKYKIPVYGIGGRLGEGHEALLNEGFHHLTSIKTPDMSVEYSIQNASVLIKDAVKRILSLHYD